MHDEPRERAPSADEELEAVRPVWLPTPDGRHPECEALAAIRLAHPSRVLEVGCGTGEFAVRMMDALPHTRVSAVDLSEEMVELATRRGVPAQHADVRELPFADESFDVVAALWVLSRVPDVEAALDEIRRVLRPGGTLVTLTHGDRHLADLRTAAGGPATVTSFGSRQGEAALRRTFSKVGRDDFETRAIFANRGVALAYLAWSDASVDWSLPEFEGPQEYTGEVTLFVAALAR